MAPWRRANAHRQARCHLPASFLITGPLAMLIWETQARAVANHNAGLGGAALRQRSMRVLAAPKENREMAPRTRTITKSADELPAESAGQQKRPDMAQFRLQVDRQTKSSYATHEDAEQAA